MFTWPVSSPLVALKTAKLCCQPPCSQPLNSLEFPQKSLILLKVAMLLKHTRIIIFYLILYQNFLSPLYMYVVVELYPNGQHNALLLSLVNFTCSGTGNDISWRVDKQILDDEELESRDIAVYQHPALAGNVSSSLVILASSENDDTSIACFVSGSLGFSYDDVVLHVKSRIVVCLYTLFNIEFVFFNE